MEEATTIALVSSMKPIYDTRIYEKIGLSLSKKYKVSILGIKTKKFFNNNQKNIDCKEVFSYKRTLIQKFFNQFIFYKKLKKIKPKVVIIHSIDLLLGAFIYKIFNKIYLIYDIRENYRQNIKYQKYYLGFEKMYLLLLVKCMERWSRTFVNHYFLAEKVFEKQLPFIKNKKYLVLENKFKRMDYYIPSKKISQKNDYEFQFIFTGTLGKWQGVDRAISLTKQLQEENINVYLKIMGHFVDDETKYMVRKKAVEHIFIDYVAEEEPLPHKLIVENIIASDFVIVSYYENKSLLYRMPTKIYEAIALAKQVILQKGSTWEDFCRKMNVGISIDFENINPLEVYERMKKEKQNITSKQKKEADWETEEEKLLSLFKNILN